jgi:hypothetical protein
MGEEKKGVKVRRVKEERVGEEGRKATEKKMERKKE